MGIDRSADEKGNLIVDDEFARQTPHDQASVPNRLICGAPLDQYTKCFLDIDHEDKQHCGLRPNGTFVRWSDR